MKKYNATISVKSKIISENDTDEIELICDGGYYSKDGNCYILYEEKAEMGMADCSVTVKISDDVVTVRRTGDFSSKMVYKCGERTEFIYCTPYADFPIVIDTNDVKFDFDEHKAGLTIDYSLNIQGEVSKHIMVITAKINVQDAEVKDNEN